MVLNHNKLISCKKVVPQTYTPFLLSMTLSKQEEKDRMDEIYKITSILIKNHDDDALPEILKVACSLLELETGIVCHAIKNEYHVYEFYSSADQQTIKGTVLNLSETFCGITLQQDKVLAINDIANSEYSDHPSHENLNVNAYIGVPIKFNEQETGTLNFSSTTPKSTPFSQADRDFVQYLGQWVSNHLDRFYYKQKIKSKNSELEELNKKLEQKNEDLNMIMQEKNQLMQILVHDLKSPLSNIKILSYLFQEFSVDEGSIELVDIFNKSLLDIFHLIEQMEILNSMENLPLTNYMEEFDLHQFLQDNLKNFTGRAEAKSINLHYNFNGDSSNITTDQNFLKRILHNLLSNAIKFSPFNKNIYVSLNTLKDHFIIEVKDEGPGISEEEQKLLFEKFSTLSNKPTNHESSSGLGLFIVKELLNSLHASIEVHSELNKGCSFNVKLPLKVTLNA